MYAHTCLYVCVLVYYMQTTVCTYVQTLYVCSRGSDSVAIMQCLSEKEWQNGVKQRMHADTYAHHKINSHSLKAYTEVPRHMCLNGMCVCAYMCMYIRTYVHVCVAPSKEIKHHKEQGCTYVRWTLIPHGYTLLSCNTSHYTPHGHKVTSEITTTVNQSCDVHTQPTNHWITSL